MPQALVEFRIEGLNQVLGQMKASQGRGFQRGASKSLAKVMRTVVVPALKSAAPHGAPHRGAPGKRGRGGPVGRNITVKQIRKRPGEFIALSAGPRAWWAHFGIGGTKDHVIGVNRTRGAGGRFQTEARFDAGHGRTATLSGRASRYLNRGEGPGRALFVNGRFYTVVRVKGVKPNDWVTRAAQGKAQQALSILARDTLPRPDGKGLQGGQ